MALGQDVGALQELAGPSEGVEHAGAVVAGVAAVVATAGLAAGEGSQVGPSAGWGAASGIRVALIRAASSVEQRPLIQAPPAWSSVMVRWRPRWAARSSRSRAFSSRRSSPSGSMTVARCRAALRSSVASRVLASASRTWTPWARRSGLPGRVSMARSMTWALVVESQPSVMASATGASTGSTNRGCEPHGGGAGAFVAAGGVGEVVLGARPAEWFDGAGGVELADHAELEGVQGGLEGLDLGEEVHQLGWLVCGPECLGQLHLRVRACRRPR